MCFSEVRFLAEINHFINYSIYDNHVIGNRTYTFTYTWACIQAYRNAHTNTYTHRYTLAHSQSYIFSPLLE